jgi:hypothetical protein
MGRSGLLNSPEFVIKANANNFPVTCLSHGGDVIELKRQRDLNGVQSGEECWIYTEFRREVSERAPGLFGLFLEIRT